jgi:hypothetical protein
MLEHRPRIKGLHWFSFRPAYFSIDLGMRNSMLVRSLMNDTSIYKYLIIYIPKDNIENADQGVAEHHRTDVDR